MLCDKKGRGERMPLKLATCDPLQLQKVGIESSLKLVPAENCGAPWRAHYVTYVGLFYAMSFYDYSSVDHCEYRRTAIRRTTTVGRQSRRNGGR